MSEKFATKLATCPPARIQFILELPPAFLTHLPSMSLSRWGVLSCEMCVESVSLVVIDHVGGRPMSRQRALSSGGGGLPKYFYDNIKLKPNIHFARLVETLLMERQLL